MSRVFLLALALIAPQLCAQPIVLGDVNSAPANINGNPLVLGAFGNDVYFVASKTAHGDELWKSDGTPAGTVMVKDINPFGSSVPRDPAAIAGKVVFRASNGVNGSEPWVTDGTEAGTFMLADIRPGSTGSGSTGLFYPYGGYLYFIATGASGSELWRTDGTSAGTSFVFNSAGVSLFAPIHVVNGLMIFAASSSATGRELWVSDGTGAGTMLLQDIRPGSGASNPQNFVLLGSQLVFMADNGTEGYEPWVTDGTVAGTAMLKDVRPGSAGSNFYGPVSLGSYVVFAANDGTNGYEPWVTDGTTAGTVLLQDIYAGATESDPDGFTVYGGRVYFRADHATNGYELYATDGTSAGTVLVKDINPGTLDSFPQKFTVANGTLYFTASDGSLGHELWKTDGTSVGTVMVRDIFVGASSSSPDKLIGSTLGLFFAAASGVDNVELWYSDGTTAGTQQMADIHPTGSSNPDWLAVTSTYCFFRALDPSVGLEPWVSNGTPGGTQMLLDINPQNSDSTVGNLSAELDGKLIFSQFSADGSEPWISDGTPVGTFQLADIVPGSLSSIPDRFTRAGNYVFFAATSSGIGRELWRTDGTAAGTQLVMDIRAGSQDSSPNYLVEYAGLLYFTANDGSGIRLWKSDGTQAGTALVATALPFPESISLLTVCNQKLFFSGSTSTTGQELWCSDGTDAGTVMVRDILPGSGNSTPQALTAMGNTLLFMASDGVHGREIWTSDGTTAGTSMVVDYIAGSSGLNIGGFTVAGGKAYFIADLGGAGTELYVCDGTAAGTFMVKDIHPTGSSGPGDVRALGNLLIFNADDGASGRELWVSDGTPAGTVLLRDTRPGGPTGDPDVFGAYAGRVYFAGDDTSTGRELWSTDGTVAGTTLAADAWAGVGSSTPTQFRIAGAYIYFMALHPQFGRELWSLGHAAPPRLVLPGAAPAWALGTGSVLLDAGAIVTDADSADFDGGSLTVRFTANGSADDRLLIQNQGTGAGQISVSGAAVSFGGTQIGTFTGGVGLTELVVTFNAACTPAAAQALVRAIEFDNVAASPTAAARGVRFALLDGDGSAAANATKRVEVYATGVFLVIATQPAGANGGTVFATQPVIEARDTLGVVQTSFTGQVTASLFSGPGGSTLVGTTTISASAGVAAFTDLAIALAGTGYVIEFSSPGMTSVFSGTFSVLIGPPASMQFQIQPGNGLGGAPLSIQPVLRVFDAGGNHVIGDNSTVVTASIQAGSGATGAILSGTVARTAVGGVVTFTDLEIDKASTGYVLQFTGGSAGTIASQPFQVSVGPSFAVSIISQPGGALVSTPFSGQPAVSIVDAGGNVAVADNTTQVVVTIATGTGATGAVLGGTTIGTVTGGLFSFSDLSIDLAGTGYQLTFTAFGLTPTTSAPFNVVTSSVPTSLSLLTQPAGATAGAAFVSQPVIAIRDGSGGIVTSDNSTQVTVSIVPGTGASGAILGGTVTVTASGGVASFTDLMIDLAGSGYQLEFTATGLTGVASANFDVAPTGGGGGGGGGGDDGGDDEGCSTQPGRHSPFGLALFAALLAMAWVRLRGARAQ